MATKFNQIAKNLAAMQRTMIEATEWMEEITTTVCERFDAGLKGLNSDVS